MEKKKKIFLQITRHLIPTLVILNPEQTWSLFLTPPWGIHLNNIACPFSGNCHDFPGSVPAQSYFSFVSEDSPGWDTAANFFLHFYYCYCKSRGKESWSNKLYCATGQLPRGKKNSSIHALSEILTLKSIPNRLKVCVLRERNHMN